MRRESRWGLALAVALALMLAACSGAAETVAERAVEEAIENDGGNVDVDIDDGSLSVQGTDEEGEEFSIDIGEGGELPDDFPVPVLDGGTVLMTNEVTSGGQTIVSATIEYDGDRIDEIVAFYDDWYQAEGGEGFRQETGSGGDQMTLWGFEDPQRTVTIVGSSDNVVVSIAAES